MEPLAYPIKFASSDLSLQSLLHCKSKFQMKGGQWGCIFHTAVENETRIREGMPYFEVQYLVNYGLTLCTLYKGFILYVSIDLAILSRYPTLKHLPLCELWSSFKHLAPVHTLPTNV